MDEIFRFTNFSLPPLSLHPNKTEFSVIGVFNDPSGVSPINGDTQGCQMHVISQSKGVEFITCPIILKIYAQNRIVAITSNVGSMTPCVL